MKPHFFLLKGDRILQHANADHYMFKSPDVTEAVAVDTSMVWTVWVIVRDERNDEADVVKVKTMCHCWTKKKAEKLLRFYREVDSFGAMDLRIEKRRLFLSAARVGGDLMPAADLLYRVNDSKPARARSKAK